MDFVVSQEVKTVRARSGLNKFLTGCGGKLLLMVVTFRNRFELLPENRMQYC